MLLKSLVLISEFGETLDIFMVDPRRISISCLRLILSLLISLANMGSFGFFGTNGCVPVEFAALFAAHVIF